MGLIVKRLHLVPVVKPIQVSVTLYVTFPPRPVGGSTRSLGMKIVRTFKGRLGSEEVSARSRNGRGKGLNWSPDLYYFLKWSDFRFFRRDCFSRNFTPGNVFAIFLVEGSCVLCALRPALRSALCTVVLCALRSARLCSVLCDLLRALHSAPTRPSLGRVFFPV
jgi:hypothetical protein